MRDPRYLLPSRLRNARSSARSSARSQFWRDKAACVASVVLEVLALLFAFVSLAAFLAALCV